MTLGVYLFVFAATPLRLHLFASLTKAEGMFELYNRKKVCQKKEPARRLTLANNNAANL